MQNPTGYTFLRKQAKWEDLWFYQKASLRSSSRTALYFPEVSTPI